MADTSPRQPPYVEFLPPEKAASQPATQPGNRLPAGAGGYWMSAPLVQRVLDKIARKDAQAFGDLVAERNRVIALLTEQARLAQEFAQQLGRARAIPMMAAVAEIQAHVEQEEIIAQVLHDQKLAQMRREGELANAARDRDAAVRGPLPALAAPAKEPPRRQTRAERIKAIRKDCEDTIAMLSEGRPYDELDADTRQIIDDCRYHATRRIKEILGED